MKLRTLVIVVAVVLVIIGVALYFLSHNSATPNTGAGTGTGQTGSLPSTGNQQFPAGQNSTGTSTNTGAVTSFASSTKFGIISNEPVLGYFVDAQSHVLVIEPDGQIKTIINNQVSVLSSLTFPNIARAAFSYDGKKALINAASGTVLQTNVFDIATKSWIKLPAGIQNPVWSPNSYQIAHLQSNSAGSETIYTINAVSASAKASAVGTIAAEDMMLQWPNKTTLIVSDKPSVYAAGSAWSYNITNQQLSPIIAEENGLETAWNNATGTTNMIGLSFSSNAGNSGGQLAMIDAKGDQKKTSFTTLPSKCGFSSATSSSFIFCAVPRDQQTLSIARLPDEYEQKVLFTADDFYKINTNDGTLNILFSDANQTLDATNLKVFNNTLFFINRYDSKLYAISL